MPRAERAAEPIRVSRTSIWLGALGFLGLAIGESMLCWLPTGGRFEWILLAISSVLIAAALLTHFDHHRRRFGVAALIFINLGIITSATVWMPYAWDPTLRGTDGGKLFTYFAWGAAWLLGCIGTIFVLVRKERRLKATDKTAETEIHATFSQLVLLGAGMLIYGRSFIGLALDSQNEFASILAVVGPALIALALIAHVEHLTLRIGRPAVILTVIGVSAWALKNLSRVFTDWMQDPSLAKFWVYGIQGIIFALGAIACFLVLSHKKAWEESR